MTQEQERAISRSTNVQLGLVVAIVVGLVGSGATLFSGYRWLDGRFDLVKAEQTKTNAEVSLIHAEIRLLNEELDVRAGDRFTGTMARSWAQKFVLLTGQPVPDPIDPSRTIQYRGVNP